MSAADITGKRFARLLVLSRAGTNSAKRATWNCVCDCGGVSTVIGKDLRSGNTKSCGCLQAEHQKSNGKKNYRHGHSRRTATYESWQSMLQRCHNPTHKSHEHYGHAGVSVCARWMVFENFLADMGIRPAGKTLDRINPSGNYEPTNCRWATATEQQRNRRSHSRYEAFGESRLLSEWAEDQRCKVTLDALQQRIAIGWGIEAAITIPKYATRSVSRIELKKTGTKAWQSVATPC